MKVILGISCYYHDSAACLLVNGTIIAAAMEERFTRIKHDNSFPLGAIRYCLEWSNLTVSDIDAVVFYEKPVVKFERILAQHLESFPRSRKVFVDTIGQWFSSRLKFPQTMKKSLGYTGPVFYVDHHLSHAASAYNLSCFPKAMILTIDGVGEWATTTIGIGDGNSIQLDSEIRFPHSLGLLYSSMTAFLGFDVNDAEYKVMGLAAYGDPKQFASEMDELIRMFDDGSYALNMDYFTFTKSDRMYNSKLEKLFGAPTRKPESSMERRYENIAAALQHKLEEVVVHMLRAGYKKYNTTNLCLAGGVALNSVVNGKILRRTPFRKLYIPPDPGDGGGAMGAALYFWCQYLGHTVHAASFYPTLGPAYSDEQIESNLQINNLKFERLEGNQHICEKIARLLSKQKIIGWFEGRMEWGPRALGTRSILASGSKNEMKDIINVKVKHRELFRPFAPVILDKFVRDYFVVDQPLPDSAKYMLFVYPFTDLGSKAIPATKHVDNTGRLQTISRNDNPLYYDMLMEYYEITGIPAIINTSFNVRGEPIVCTPADAIQCFLNTDIDYLMIGSFLVKK